MTPDPKDPGLAPSDPARRPGQPGAERQPVDDTPTGEKPPRPEETDDRGDPIGDPPVDGGVGEPAREDPDVNDPPLSNGSLRRGPA
jgi:hypothetical protein